MYFKSTHRGLLNTATFNSWALRRIAPNISVCATDSVDPCLKIFGIYVLFASMFAIYCLNQLSKLIQSDEYV